MISIIVAISENSVIGIDNKIPWNCTEDLQHFKKTTENNVVIMGRKTWDSIGNKCLKNRHNIVISNNKNNIIIKNVKESSLFSAASSLEEAIEIAKESPIKKHPEIFIIGGESIYKQCLHLDIAQRIYCSVIDNIIIDRNLPNIKIFDFNTLKWKLISIQKNNNFTLKIFEKDKINDQK